MDILTIGIFPAPLVPAIAGGAEVEHAVLPEEAEDFGREALELAASE